MRLSSDRLNALLQCNSAKHLAIALAVSFLFFLSLTSVHSSHLMTTEPVVGQNNISHSVIHSVFETHDHSNNICEQLCLMSLLHAYVRQTVFQLSAALPPIHFAMALRLWQSTPDGPPPKQQILL